MSVRKRKWTTRSGEAKEAWIVDYFDEQGTRHIKTFERKKDADAHAQQVGVDVRAGTHTPASKSITIAQAAADWIAYVELEGRERATSRATASTSTCTSTRGWAAEARQADDAAHQQVPRRPAGGYVPPAGEEGADQPQVAASRMRSGAATSPRTWPETSPSASTSATSASSRWASTSRPGRRSSAILDAASGRLRPLLVTAVFTGLRASELRGLRWDDVDLKARRAACASACRPLQRHRHSRSRIRASAPSRSART